MLSKRVAMINAQVGFRVDKDTWPPDQPHNFIPLLLVCHEGEQGMNQAVEIAKMVHKGDITSVAAEQSLNIEIDDPSSHDSEVTKDVSKILAPLEENDDPQFILVEGAPGIGKSVLLREIAYRWGKQQLLQTFTLVLLVCLRDPIVQQATSISDLLLPFCKGDRKAKEISVECSDYLFENGGKYLLFIFDGFDEFPECLRTNSLIGDIINRNILPLCGLIVSSRPHASVILRTQANIKVDILGFTEEERQHYIEQSLKRQPQGIEKLTNYLQGHLTIKNLCLIPFNIAILLFLFKMGIPLPTDTSKLYHYFICLTIRRHLAKSGHPLNTKIEQLTDLPEPYSKIIKQLSRLALQALNNNQLVFTYEEIKAACPNIVASPETINGFGLLQAIQHYGLTEITMTFNFLHITIQEYLAANCIITDTPQDKELCLLQEKFWSDIHANLFSIYVSLSKGQRSAFQKFLSGGDDHDSISSEFLSDKLKSMRLFHCFLEAQDSRMCKSIEEATIFRKKVISFNGMRLSTSDLESMAVFLTASSHKQWVELSIYECYIQDNGLQIIHRYLHCKNITIRKFQLSYNGLTKSSASLVTNIVLTCAVEVLWISGNRAIGESQELYKMLTDSSSMLTRLNLHSTSLSTVAARSIFTALKSTNKLKELWIYNNLITDDVADDVTAALTVNRSLEVLWMHRNPISEGTIATIVCSLKSNYTLQLLYVTVQSSAVKDRIRATEQEVNTNRRFEGVKSRLALHYW